MPYCLLATPLRSSHVTHSASTTLASCLECAENAFSLGLLLIVDTHRNVHPLNCWVDSLTSSKTLPTCHCHPHHPILHLSLSSSHCSRFPFSFCAPHGVDGALMCCVSSSFAVLVPTVFCHLALSGQGSLGSWLPKAPWKVAGTQRVLISKNLFKNS